MAAAKKDGTLFIVSGPSGTGKTTLCRALEKDLGLFFSVSATTRSPRPGETEARDYYFISAREFDRMTEADLFLEWEQVHGNRYGTPREPVENQLRQGKDVLLDIDTEGALRLKKRCDNVVLIFVQVPSLEVLKSRLETRATESRETIARRLERAEQEHLQSVHYDYIIVNHNLEEALRALTAIISERRSLKEAPAS